MTRRVQVTKRGRGARSWLRSGGLAALVAVLAAGGSAEAQSSGHPMVDSGHEAWQQFRGQVLFSDVLLAPPAEFPSPAARIASLRRTHRTEVEGSSDFWRIHFVAFLDPPPKTGSLVLRATDVTDPKEPFEIRLFEATAEPGDRELDMDDFVLTGAMGFLRNHRYEIAVERRDDESGAPTAGKRDVYAKGVVTLR